MKDQEEESIKAIKAIEKRVEEETEKAMKLIENQLNEESRVKTEQNKTNLSNLEKQYEKKLTVLKNEKDRVLEDLVKIQTENDIVKEKVDSAEKNEKIKRNLKLFNSLVKENDPTNKTDECISSVACDGDCDNVNQLKRLNSLKK